MGKILKNKEELVRKVNYLKYLIKIRKIIAIELPFKLNQDIVSRIFNYCMFPDTHFRKLKIPKYLKEKK